MNEFRSKYGPWALVTGASAGIGEEFCRQLATRGMSLIFVARRQQRLEQLASELEQQYGVQSKVIAGDLEKEGFLSELYVATLSLELGLLGQ